MEAHKKRKKDKRCAQSDPFMSGEPQIKDSVEKASKNLAPLIGVYRSEGPFHYLLRRNRSAGGPPYGPDQCWCTDAKRLLIISPLQQRGKGFYGLRLIWPVRRKKHLRPGG